MEIKDLNKYKEEYIKGTIYELPIEERKEAFLKLFENADPNHDGEKCLKYLRELRGLY